MELNERVNRIETNRDLSQFVAALRADLATHPEQWENPTLDRFLEAMGAWIEDTVQASADPPTWKTFGDILMGARVYE